MENEINPPVETQKETVPSSPFKKTLTRKQVILSLGSVSLIFIGFLGIGFSKLSKDLVVSTNVAVSQPQKAPLGLMLESPSADSVVTEGTVTVRGKTLPGSSVALFTENSENFVESNTEGKFEGEIGLSGGVNTLTVTVFSKEGEEKSLVYNLVYDDQVKGVKTPPGQEKKESKAVIGNVEKTTPNSITIEEKKVNKKTEAIIDSSTQIINQNKKKIKLDLVKKDDIAAVIASESGKVKKMYVLEATASAQIKRKAVSGIITGVSGEMITLTHQIKVDRIYQVYFNQQTIIKSKSALLPSNELAIGLRVAVVGDLDENGRLVAKMIHVIPGKATGVISKYPTFAPLTSTPSASPTEEATPSSTPILSPTPFEEILPSATPSL